MVITDLDGTLASGGIVPETSTVLLKKLGEKAVLRTIATGRSLSGTEKVLGPDFPIDYLIFSSGAGVLHWPTREILQTHQLNRSDAQSILGVLSQHGLNFMLHHPIPNNHHFFFWEGENPQEDFKRRVEKHKELGKPWGGEIPEVISQFLVVSSFVSSEGVWQGLKKALPQFNVIRATSPLDGQSAWLEIFSKKVSKSLAASWLTQSLQVDVREVLAIGNDYNDHDLLSWAGTSYVVADAIPTLIDQFPKVKACAEGGFCEAVRLWEQRLQD